MKKALPGQKEVFLIQRHGRVQVWDFFAEEIMGTANRGLENEPAFYSPEYQVARNLSGWLSRYLKEGETDRFLDDLNAALREIRYTKVVLPLDLLPAETDYPQNGYVAQYDRIPTPAAYAADDFSKLLASGELRRLKRCKMEGCEKFFLGPPQAMWCSKTCGSKFRVRKKRKKDSS